MGLLSAIEPVEPRNLASPKEKMPPSEADIVEVRFQRAQDLDPLEGVYPAERADADVRSVLAQTRPTRQTLVDAMARLGDALRLQPGNPLFLVALARARTLWAEAFDPVAFVDADVAWRRATAADPHDWQVWSLYGEMLTAWSTRAVEPSGFRRQAKAALDHVLRIKPDEVAAWINLAQIDRALGDRSGAAVAARHALALDPANVRAHQLLAQIGA